MKIFCQKCGNGLPAHALICPKCGFENKIVDGKLNFFKFTIFILAILFIAGGFYFYRGEIVSYYKKVKIENGRIAIDVDAGNKDEFKKGFESYVFESRNLILATGGYSQIFENTTSSLICSGDGSALVFKAGFRKAKIL